VVGAGTEERRATAQLPLSSIERLSHRPGLLSRAPKEGMKDLVHHMVSLNLSDGLIMLYGHPVASKIAL